jgi:hypothetical protein
VETKKAAIVMQQLSKNIPAATDTHATTKESLETVFPI